MNLQTKYISADEFLQYTGINLHTQLKDDDNQSNKVNAFILRIETRMEAFINANFYRNVDKEFPNFTEYQKEHYKLALIEQTLYILRNSDISTDSGYDPERGETISADKLKAMSIAPNAKDQLMLCGLWCRKILNRGRMGGYDWWLY